MKKEVRFQSTHYKIETLDSVYTPIYKILIQNVIPGEGYESIDNHDLDNIIKIIDEHVNLVDPKLNNIIWSLREEERFAWDARQNNPFVYLDENRVLLNHVVSYYNKLRKAVGLPYEKQWKDKLFALNNSFRRHRNRLKRLVIKRSRIK